MDRDSLGETLNIMPEPVRKDDLQLFRLGRGHHLLLLRWSLPVFASTVCTSHLQREYRKGKYSICVLCQRHLVAFAVWSLWIILTTLQSSRWPDRSTRAAVLPPSTEPRSPPASVTSNEGIPVVKVDD